MFLGIFLELGRRDGVPCAALFFCVREPADVRGVSTEGKPIVIRVTSSRKYNNMRDRSASLPNAACIATTGETFRDGAILEVVSDARDDKQLSLAFWDGQEVTIGRRLKCFKRFYKPATIDPGMLQALRFPKGAAASVESPTSLLADISATIQRYSGLGESSATLVAYFPLASWVVDVIPVAPRLSILGAETIATTQLLRLLNCFCRHSLILTEVDAAGLSSLSTKWRPTVLITQPRLSAAVQQLLCATRQRNVHVLRKGRLSDVFCAVATFSCMPQNFSAIEIPVGPSGPELKILSDSEEQKITETFQDRLLAYRFSNHRKVLSSTFDVPHFTFAMRELARSFGRCTPDDADLQQKVIRLLAVQDADIRSERWSDVTTVVVEALLAACHEEGKTHIYIGELAELVEVILGGRGENRKVSAREVGQRIKPLGLVTEPRDSKGFKLRLTQIVRRRVHNLAHSLDAPTIDDGIVRCADCISRPQTSHAETEKKLEDG